MSKEKEEVKQDEFPDVHVRKVENGGYVIDCSYQSLSNRAGWTPSSSQKTYVEKTKDSVLKRLKELL